MEIEEIRKKLNDPPSSLPVRKTLYANILNEIERIEHHTKLLIKYMLDLGALDLHYDIYTILGHARFLKEIVARRLEGIIFSLNQLKKNEKVIKDDSWYSHRYGICKD